MDLLEFVKYLIEKLVCDIETLDIRYDVSANENEAKINVTGNCSDISMLIGRRGVTANAIRNLVLIKARDMNKRVSINFQSYENTTL